ncbi:MAG: hypothetical protein PHY14_03350 [Candidatus Gracilibacteria bacterium]|nr:hypothetical protein [Candidatus Gracilibacteria bacterium]
MMTQYFASLYAQLLRRKLQKMRLHFSREFDTFQTVFQREGFSRNTEKHLDTISIIFSQIFSRAQKIEKLETKIGKESATEENDYILSLYRDIFSLLTTIRGVLTERYNSLRKGEYSLNAIKKSTVSGKDLIDLERVINYTLEENIKRALDKTEKNISILQEECQKYGLDFLVSP